MTPPSRGNPAQIAGTEYPPGFPDCQAEGTIPRVIPPAGLGKNRDRGSLSVELAVVIPGLLLLMLIVALGGRLVEAQGAVDGAARDAARAASLARYPGTGVLGADTLAQQAAGGDLTSWCTGNHLNVTVAGFPGVGQPAPLGDNVTVTVQCDIDTSIFGVFHLGLRHQMTSVAVAPLDPYMCRGLAC